MSIIDNSSLSLVNAYNILTKMKISNLKNDNIKDEDIYALLLYLGFSFTFCKELKDSDDSIDEFRCSLLKGLNSFTNFKLDSNSSSGLNLSLSDKDAYTELIIKDNRIKIVRYLNSLENVLVSSIEVSDDRVLSSKVSYSIEKGECTTLDYYSRLSIYSGNTELERSESILKGNDEIIPSNLDYRYAVDFLSHLNYLSGINSYNQYEVNDVYPFINKKSIRRGGFIHVEESNNKTGDYPVSSKTLDY